MVINLLCCSFGNAFVSTFATMSFVEQYLKITSPFSTHSRTKWCCTSMCFVRACCMGFFVNELHLGCHIESPLPFSLSCTLIPSWSLPSIWLPWYLPYLACIRPRSLIMRLWVVVCYSKKQLHLPSWIQTLWWTSYPQGHWPNLHHNI